MPVVKLRTLLLEWLEARLKSTGERQGWVRVQGIMWDLRSTVPVVGFADAFKYSSSIFHSLYISLFRVIDIRDCIQSNGLT